MTVAMGRTVRLRRQRPATDRRGGGRHAARESTRLEAAAQAARTAAGKGIVMADKDTKHPDVHPGRREKAEDAHPHRAPAKTRPSS